MKGILLVFPLIALTSSPLFAETIKLVCKTELSQTDTSVKELYDVTVVIQEDKAILNIDGNEFVLDKDDQGVDEPERAFYRWDPWYRFAINNKYIAPEQKYILGIPTEEEFARYTLCEEVR